MKTKDFCLIVVFGTILLLAALALPTIVVDPCFHYRAPEGVYLLHNQRYQNDGIIRHFEYDAMITGSSMTENFKASQLDSLFHVCSIKVPYAGARFKEIDRAVNAAIESNENLKLVVRSLDLPILDAEKDSVRYDNCPTYLYDDNLLNDVNYVLNKQILLEQTREFVKNRQANEESTGFDEYSSWGVDVTLSEIYKNVEFPDVKDEIELRTFTKEDQKRVQENIRQNVVNTAIENPEVTFYLFFPPYSCIFYDELIRNGELDYQIAVQKCAIEEMLGYDNIKLYSFCNWYDVTCDLGRYMDMEHYDAVVSSSILEKMKREEGLLTKNNYQEHLNEIKKYYESLDMRQYYKQ